MLYLGLLLHFYQPPGQIPGVLRRIVEESYRPLIRVFAQHENARASFNINAVLTEMLDDHGYRDVIEGIGALARTERVEITSSGKYHPILPLIPRAEAARQIQLNDATNERLFGSAYRPRGFFPPEMAWDHAVAPLVAGAGLDWVIMSGIACPAAWPVDRVYREQAGERQLAVLFRDDILSNQISFKTVDARHFLDALRHQADGGGDRYLVLAMDAETYGHHIPRWEEEFLGALFALLAGRGRGRAPHPPVRLATLSEIVDRFPAAGTVTPRASSWSTTKDDIDHGSPYPLWRHRGNEIHRLLWRHLDQALAIFEVARGSGNGDGNQDFATARAFADIALHSDQFWWASRRPHWSVNLVHRGLNMQRDLIVNAVRAVNLSDAHEDARRDVQERVAIARDLADRVTDRLFWD
jgi:alpha-amylase/alpha-mannosidase (GH57 family)